MQDNTKYVELVHPGHGGTVKVPCSERHNGGKGIEFYRAKGFLTLEEKAQRDTIAAQAAEIERLKAEKKGR